MPFTGEMSGENHGVKTAFLTPELGESVVMCMVNPPTPNTVVEDLLIPGLRNTVARGSWFLQGEYFPQGLRSYRR